MDSATISVKYSLVMPVRDRIEHLHPALAALFAAARRYGNAEVILVDHQSTHVETHNILAEAAQCENTVVVKFTGQTVGGARNFGITFASGDILVFVDSDVVVIPEYLQAIEDAMCRSGCHAVGSEYALPDNACILESAWDSLSSSASNGDREYINSGNLAILSWVFRDIGGFNSSLVSGEDVDLGRRLNAHGYRVFEDKSVKAIHLGNPKSFREFYAKQLWHGSSIPTGGLSMNKVVIMSLTHILLLLTGVLIVTASTALGLASKMALALALASSVPLASILFRVYQGRRPKYLGTCYNLFHLYFIARSWGMTKVLARRLVSSLRHKAERDIAA